MEGLTTDLLIEFGYAAGIGLFVGLEREHSEAARERIDPAEEHAPAGRKDIAPMGVRTFALLSLLGWASAFGADAWPWLPPVTLFLAGGLIAAQYFVIRDLGFGLTTEVAALVVFTLGMMVRVNRPLAVALALATTLLLISKPFVRNIVFKLRRVELTATLQLLVLLAIVLPLLPEEPSDPWNALPPRKIGLFVVLIGGIGYVGYVLTRILGRKRSAGLTGLVGGLTSSTAVTASMAAQAKEDAGMRLPGQLATFLANAVMFARVLVITAVLSKDVALALAWPMSAMGLVMLGGAIWSWRKLGLEEARRAEAGDEEEDPEPPFGNPFALVPALKWGAIICVVLLLAALAKQFFGHRGLLLAAGASGLADVDAITLAVTDQAAAHTLSVGVASLAIAIAVISNTVVKGGIAVIGGGKAFGVDIAKVFGLAIVVGAAIALRAIAF